MIMGSTRIVFSVFVVASISVFAFVPAGSFNLGQARISCVTHAAQRGSCVCALSASLEDGIGERRRVGFVNSDLNEIEEEKEEEDVIEVRAELQTVNKRLLEEITEQGKGITVATEESKRITRREEDLNGVNPFYAALGAAGAGGMSFGAWKATTWLAQAYYSKPPEESDIMALNRLSAFVKQAVVGIFALGTGIFGVTALGMGIMAGIVAVGVAKGELDPSPQASISSKINADVSPEEKARLRLARAQDLVRKADKEIQREISGKTSS